MEAENKLGILDPIELSREEERIGKLKAIDLFEKGCLDEWEPGRVETLFEIHRHLFGDLYDWAGKTRNVNLSKGGFLFSSFYILTPLWGLSKECLRMILGK